MPFLLTGYNTYRQCDGEASSFDFTTRDLTGDGFPDLVVTLDNCEPTLGGTHWNLYAGACDG